MEALKFVIHFVADLHQPLHCEDDGDNGGNARHVIFDGHPDNLHWVWDTGLLQHITRDPEALAAELVLTCRSKRSYSLGVGRAGLQPNTVHLSKYAVYCSHSNERRTADGSYDRKTSR
ncbi:MAG: S1/P1 nuclease, partial [Terriglobia bacterium]